MKMKRRVPIEERAAFSTYTRLFSPVIITAPG